MRIFYHKSVDEFVRRLVPGIAVVALAAWGIVSGGAVLEEIPELTTAQAAEVAGNTAEAGAGSGAAAGNVTYQDGTYTGTAPGFGGDITVSVTIADGKMTAIEIVSAAGETPSFLARAKTIISKMLETQSADVDVVSGATYSSNGIINAVKNALVKASGGTVKETTGSSGLGGGSTGGGGGSTSSDAFTDGTYADGTYTGSASGYGGTITVSVKISGGKIASISIVSASGETASYLAKAKAVINKVISAQSPNVDAVSGATYSSNGILNAIKKALNKAAAANGGTTTDTDDNNDDDDTSTAEPDRTYTDGTYTGTGEGYGGDISVKVTILNSRIDAIDIVSAEDETPSFFARARTLIATILKKQTTTNVDVVSGATYSSNGILDAVNEALDKAAGTYVEPEKPDTDPDDAEPDTKPDDNNEENPEKPDEQTTTETLTYTASAICSPNEDEEFDAYDLQIKCTVEQVTTVSTDAEGNTTTTVTRKLTGVEVVNPTSGSNWTYIKKAINGTSKSTGVAAQAVGKQGFGGIDAVSGATCSSNAIVAAGSQIDLNLGTFTK
ncbi:MAG: FMN-binding protein [Eubacteriales bacterium]|nr:FMN-binding protein [Eubacteriales bacterium]